MEKSIGNWLEIPIGRELIGNSNGIPIKNGWNFQWNSNEVGMIHDHISNDFPMESGNFSHSLEISNENFQ